METVIFQIQQIYTLSICKIFTPHTSFQMTSHFMSNDLTLHFKWPHTSFQMTSHFMSNDLTLHSKWPHTSFQMTSHFMSNYLTLHVKWPHISCQMNLHFMSNDLTLHIKWPHTSCQMTSHFMSNDLTLHFKWPHTSCQMTSHFISHDKENQKIIQKLLKVKIKYFTKYKELNSKYYQTKHMPRGSQNSQAGPMRQSRGAHASRGPHVWHSCFAV